MGGTEFDPSSPALSLTLVSALFPVLLGGVATYFKLFMVPTTELRERINLQKASLVERLALLHGDVLEHVRSIGADEVLRGDGRNQRDLIGDYAQEVFRLFSIFSRLDFVLRFSRAVYKILFATILLGIIGMFTSLAFDQVRPYVFWGSIVLVFLQAIPIYVLHSFRERLELDADIL